jgi:flagellar hook-length control protein FliK
MIPAIPVTPLAPMIPAQLPTPAPASSMPFELLIAREIILPDADVSTEAEAPLPVNIPLKTENVPTLPTRGDCEIVAPAGSRRPAPVGEEPAESEIVEPERAEDDVLPVVFVQVPIAPLLCNSAENIRPEAPVVTNSLPTKAVAPDVDYSVARTAVSEKPAVAKVDTLPTRVGTPQQQAASQESAPLPCSAAPAMPPTLTSASAAPGLETLIQEVAKVTETLTAPTPKPFANPPQAANITAEQWMTARVMPNASKVPTHPTVKTNDPVAATAEQSILEALTVPPAQEPVKVTAPVPMSLSMLDISGSPADPVIDRQLDFTASDRWLSDLASEVASFSEPQGKLIFRLSPESLGQLEVSVSRREDGVSVEIEAGSEEAQSVLSSNLPKLEQELRGKLRGSVETQIWTGAGTSGQGERQSQPRPAFTAPQSHSSFAADNAADPDTPQNSGLFA